MLNGKLKNLFSTSDVPENKEFEDWLDSIESCIKKKTDFIYSNTRLPFKDCSAYEEVKNLKGETKIEFLEYLLDKINAYRPKKNIHYDKGYDRHCIHTNLLDSFMRTKFDFPKEYSFYALYRDIYNVSDNELWERPFGSLVTQIEKMVKTYGLLPHLSNEINAILKEKKVAVFIGSQEKAYFGPDIAKAVKRLQQLLVSDEDREKGVHPKYELGEGQFSLFVKDFLAGLPPEKLNQWNAIFHHLSTASGAKPSKKFLQVADALIKEMGESYYQDVLIQTLKTAASFEIKITEHKHRHADYEYSTYTFQFIETHHYDLIKGMLWSMSHFGNSESAQVIASFSEKCFQKVPEHGPVAVALGNAGIYALASAPGIEGFSHLSRLKLRIRQKSTQKLIQKYIDEQAKKRGIKSAQLEELAAPKFGLQNARLTEVFNDYQLEISVTGVGKVELIWIKPDGKPQKTPPAFIKTDSDLSNKFKKVKDKVKQIKQASTAQRDRIDRLFTADMSWSLADVENNYIHHGLISVIASKLIWLLGDEAGIYVDGAWHDVSGNIFQPENQVKIKLWHPVLSTPSTVMAWRDRLEHLQIVQPIKQAFREIYILTEAELQTRIYSNRMAAHILKQHQFSSLAAVRGWKYSLMGAFDDGRDNTIASKDIPEYGLQAEYWINEILDDHEAYNDAGIWNYVATDQVRFCNEEGHPVPLVDIPPIVLSEIMRDVDLFVGVSSVGNDPAWMDGGPEGHHRDYWQSYSFGKLSELGKTRKVVLEKLIPRLKIKDKAKIEGNFLHVQGKRHLYKIHIGSGNILIAPHDQYLCIVASRGKDKDLNQVYLPFEGDNGLSVVLSKAFLLAEDDKITDPTILSQL